MMILVDTIPKMEQCRDQYCRRSGKRRAGRRRGGSDRRFTETDDGTTSGTGKLKKK